MGRYLARRLITTFVVLLLVSFISFCIMQMVPGDPALVMAGAAAPAMICAGSPGTICMMQKEMKLTRIRTISVEISRPAR